MQVARTKDLICPARRRGVPPLPCDCDHCRWRARPDEVICDGGDDVPFARVARPDARGLAATETVAAFRTLDGTQHHTASNRVCLYSPRFFATRQVWPITQHEVVQSVGRHPQGPSGRRRINATSLANWLDDRQQAHSQGNGPAATRRRDAVARLIARQCRVPRKRSRTRACPGKTGSRSVANRPSRRIASRSADCRPTGHYVVVGLGGRVILDDQMRPGATRPSRCQRGSCLRIADRGSPAIDQARVTVGRTTPGMSFILSFVLTMSARNPSRKS